MSFDSPELLKKNWPSIKFMLRVHGGMEEWSQNRFKELYFKSNDGIKPILSKYKHGEPTHIGRLLLAHEIDDEILDELSIYKRWETGSRDGKRNAIATAKCVIDEFSGLSSVTFGPNTYFKGKELEIIEALGYFSKARLEGVSNESAVGFQRRKDWSECLGRTSSFNKFLLQTVPAAHNISWMNVYLWRARINGISESMPIDKQKVFGFCDLLAADWARKNPDILDTRVAELSRLICETLESKSVASSVREYFEELVARKSNAYLRDKQPGKKVTVAVKYKKGEQLRAMLVQLDPRTRYPVYEDDLLGSIYPRRVWQDMDSRKSRQIVESKWSSGIEFESFKIIDRTTLLCYPKPSIEYSHHGLKGLSWDATDLETKYLSKNPVVGDEDTVSDEERFPSAVVIGEEREDWYVASTYGGYPLHVESTPALSSFASDCQSEEDLAIKLASERGRLLWLRELESFFERSDCALQL